MYLFMLSYTDYMLQDYRKAFDFLAQQQDNQEEVGEQLRWHCDILGEAEMMLIGAWWEAEEQRNAEQQKEQHLQMAVM